MVHSRLLTAACAALAVVAALAACTPDTSDLEAEVDELRTELQSRRADRTALEQRLDDIEAAVAGATADDGTADRLAEVNDELARIVDAVTVLEEDLAAEASARAQLSEEVEVADTDLRNGLADVRGQVDSVRGTVGLLKDQVEVLRERVDRATG